MESNNGIQDTDYLDVVQVFCTGYGRAARFDSGNVAAIQEGLPQSWRWTDLEEWRAGKTKVFRRAVAHAPPRMITTISNLREERDQKKQAAAELRPCSQRRPRRTASARKDAKRPTAVRN